MEKSTVEIQFLLKEITDENVKKKPILKYFNFFLIS